MKRCIKCGLFMAALAVLFSLGAAALPPQTGNATTYTYTLNAENGWTRTQDAYLTGEVLFLNAPLTRPEDLTVRGRMLYVADTGAGRILRYDLDTGETASLGEGILQTPTGVFVTGEGNIYVADPDRAVVTMLSPEGGCFGNMGGPKPPPSAKIPFTSRERWRWTETAFCPLYRTEPMTGLYSLARTGSSWDTSATIRCP